MTTGHSPWDELAVGHALGALEPEDEQSFLSHLRGCDLCGRTLADMQAVTGQLAYGVEPAEPPASLLQSIMAEVRSSDRVRTAPAQPPRRRRERHSTEPIPLESRPRRRTAPSAQPAWLAIAAAFALVVAMTGWNLLLRADNQAKTRALRIRNEVASAMADPQTQTAALSGTKAPGAHAQVLVKGNQAYLVVEGLQRNNLANNVYVLWKGDAQGKMVGVRRFDIVHDGPNIIPITDIGDPSKITQFAVSIEPGRAIPPRPSNPIAAGRLTA